MEKGSLVIFQNKYGPASNARSGCLAWVYAPQETESWGHTIIFPDGYRMVAFTDELEVIRHGA